MRYLASCYFFFFFNDTATTEIYTLSLHDALPILHQALVAAAFGIVQRHADGGHHQLAQQGRHVDHAGARGQVRKGRGVDVDRKSTRLNSSHSQISYAVFCLKKKNSPSHPATRATAYSS